MIFSRIFNCSASVWMSEVFKMWLTLFSLLWAKITKLKSQGKVFFSPLLSLINPPNFLCFRSPIVKSIHTPRYMVKETDRGHFSLRCITSDCYIPEWHICLFHGSVSNYIKSGIFLSFIFNCKKPYTRQRKKTNCTLSKGIKSLESLIIHCEGKPPISPVFFSSCLMITTLIAN